MPDRRTDTGGRDRYDELAASWHAAVERLDARYSKVVVAVMIVGVVALSAVTLGIFVMRSTNEDAEQTTAALCALRADLERRVENGRQFMAENPEGVAGIPRATLLKSIAEQQRTIRALSGIDCPE